MLAMFRRAADENLPADCRTVVPTVSEQLGTIVLHLGRTHLLALHVSERGSKRTSTDSATR